MCSPGWTRTSSLPTTHRQFDATISLSSGAEVSERNVGGSSEHIGSEPDSISELPDELLGEPYRHRLAELGLTTHRRPFGHLLILFGVEGVLLPRVMLVLVIGPP